MTNENRVKVLESDITSVRVDAIVNAANAELSEGGAVCGAIFRAAGVDKLTEACRRIGGYRTESAVLTPAFDIDGAQYTIHAVGPIHAQHSAEEARGLLRSAYKSAIELASQNGCSTTAFPAISTGIYGYPLEDACQEAVDCLQRHGKAARHAGQAGRLRSRDLRVSPAAFEERL